MENLDAYVIKKKPDTVFIEFGINDCVERFHCSVEQSQTNLENMIDRLLKSNSQCEIILMTMTPGDGPPPGNISYRKDIALYYEMYRKVAKNRKLLRIDHYPNWKDLEAKNKRLFDKYVQDSIHPNADGCQQIVLPVILKALGLPAEPKTAGGGK